MEGFYNQLQDVLDSLPKKDFTLVVGDFNAKIGSGVLLEGEREVIGQFGLVEVVNKFNFLGAYMYIYPTGGCQDEIRRRLAMGRSTMAKLQKIWTDRDVTKATKIKLVHFQLPLMPVNPGLSIKQNRTESMLLRCGVGGECCKSPGQLNGPTLASSKKLAPKGS